MDTRDGREALRIAVRVALRIPAQLTLYSVLGQSSERYSYLVGRTDEQAVLDKARDSFGKALEFGAAGVPPELKPRTVLLQGAVVESLAELGPDDVGMLICGSRGCGPARRVLLGHRGDLQQLTPQVAAGAGTSWLVAWEGRTSSDGGLDVYAAPWRPAP